MNEQNLTKILKDLANRVEYIREDMKKENKKGSKHLKSLYSAKENLLCVIENNINSIIGTFAAIEVLDENIKKDDKHNESLAEKELSKYDKD